MIKTITCIECPVGCALSVDIENCRVIKVSGNKCPKGEPYAASEVENPLRILTSAVLSRNLPLKMVPVRTDKPIPKSRIMEAMAEVKKIKVNKSLKVGETVAANFLGLDVNLIATRDVI
jgi:CxxC motif-containing protein